MDEVRIGIVGMGRGSGHLLRLLRVPGARVVACADRIEERRERAAELAGDGAVELFVEYEEMLERTDLDAVVVSTNGLLQGRHAIMALEAGCHVFSEIPGANTREELHRVIAAVEQSGKRYMLAENACFWDFLRYWRKWLVEGRFGAISAADAEYLHFLPTSMITRAGERLTPAQAQEQGIGDALWTWRAAEPPIKYCTHDLGPLLEVMDDRVVSVSCRSGPNRQTQSPLRPDLQIALMQTAKGALVRIHIALDTCQPSTHNFRLFGTHGSAEWFRYENEGRLLPRDRHFREGWLRADIRSARPGAETGGHGGADIQTVTHFIECLLAGREMPIDHWRMADYALPGIVAAESAELGGQPIGVPDVRTGPREPTRFWEHVGLPEDDPPMEEWARREFKD